MFGKRLFEDSFIVLVVTKMQRREFFKINQKSGK